MLAAAAARCVGGVCVVGGGLIQVSYGGGVWHEAMVLVCFAFGGAYWPLAIVHSDPLWVRTCLGCVNRASG